MRGAGIAGRGIWHGAKAIGALAAGVVQARGILGRIGAGCVVGFGGYPCVAPILAATSLRHRPSIILQEQNAILGRANRFLAARADVLALGFQDTQRVPAGTKTEFTGNPVRPSISALAQAGYIAPGDHIRLLILGGSLGARVFSDVVPAALGALPDSIRTRLSVVQQTRPEDLERVSAAYTANGIAAELSPFFPDVAARLVASHLVIARAGASTVAELAAEVNATATAWTAREAATKATARGDCKDAKRATNCADARHMPVTLHPAQESGGCWCTRLGRAAVTASRQAVCWWPQGGGCRQDRSRR